MTEQGTQVFHENGHFDGKQTLAQISARFWWYGLSSDVTVYVMNCLNCAVSKSNGRIQWKTIDAVSIGFIDLVRLSVFTLFKELNLNQRYLVECAPVLV